MNSFPVSYPTHLRHNFGLRSSRSGFQGPTTTASDASRRTRSQWLGVEKKLGEGRWSRRLFFGGGVEEGVIFICKSVWLIHDYVRFCHLFTCLPRIVGFLLFDTAEFFGTHYCNKKTLACMFCLSCVVTVGYHDTQPLPFERSRRRMSRTAGNLGKSG